MNPLENLENPEVLELGIKDIDFLLICDRLISVKKAVELGGGGGGGGATYDNRPNIDAVTNQITLMRDTKSLGDIVVTLQSLRSRVEDLKGVDDKTLSEVVSVIDAVNQSVSSADAKLNTISQNTVAYGDLANGKAIERNAKLTEISNKLSGEIEIKNDTLSPIRTLQEMSENTGSFTHTQFTNLENLGNARNNVYGDLISYLKNNPSQQFVDVNFYTNKLSETSYFVVADLITFSSNA